MKKVFVKDDKAVSPIIATILLVAITVVLAATLYTILGGYTTFLGASTPQASITVENASSPSDAFYFVFVNQFGGNISLDKVQLELFNTNNSVYYTTLGTDLGKQVSVGAWNISVKGTTYFTGSTVISISQNMTSTHDPDLSHLRLVDLSTNGVIATYAL